jgi:hypothetical protein
LNYNNLTEKEKQIWNAALTLANNLCVQVSDRYNDDDETTKADVAEECAKAVRSYIDDYGALEDIPEIQSGGMSWEDIELEQTCGACPEQYDAFYQGRQVGYLRLRWGHFRVDFPSCGSKTIYEASPQGDGIFEWEEREYYLTEAKKAIAKML